MVLPLVACLFPVYLVKSLFPFIWSFVFLTSAFGSNPHAS
uniref:Uncharacterized protein n=1 Tax=Anguilla anguilla TaxID=7936 RepID=A0A0E9TKJ8_ANGAN